MICLTICITQLKVIIQVKQHKEELVPKDPIVMSTISIVEPEIETKPKPISTQEVDQGLGF